MSVNKECGRCYKSTKKDTGGMYLEDINLRLCTKCCIEMFKWLAFKSKEKAEE